MAKKSTEVGRLFWTALAATSFASVLRAGIKLNRGGRRTEGVGVAVLLTLLFLAMGLGLLSREGEGWTRSQALLGPMGVAVIYGLWLLARQWTWGEWVAWAVPLIVSAVLSFLVPVGSVLHALYADGLSLSPADLDVPVVWQVVSAMKLLTFLSLVLIVPALWGVAKHHHYVRPGEQFNGLLYALALVLVLGGVGSLAMGSASRAVQRTIVAAKEGRQPPSYFGVEPEWTCVEPTVPQAKLSGEGGYLVPRRPYLLFGVARGKAVLWNTDTEGPLKLPAADIRLVPTKTAHDRCGGKGR
ncbi:hypothetical protein [Streptomyces sp. 8N616]|uniref:hypothetical protein n=1 Tax=Streptomyces sp. 8N616 TaxID=3457414 RepID=UPI003FD11816